MGAYLDSVSALQLMYCCIALWMWALTTLMSKRYFKGYHNLKRYYFFSALTLIGTLGVFLAKDLSMLFMFFEWMSFASYLLVAHDEKKETMRAAQTYLFVAVAGGLVLLMGIMLFYHATGTLVLAEMRDAAANVAPEREKEILAAGICMLIGFGAKAGLFPLHIWLPKAHPVAPAPASAILSGMLTKTGIYGILLISTRLFYHDGNWGVMLVVLGIVTMLTGAVLALFSNNLKKALACSSVSQIGFISVGLGAINLLGAENTLAVKGTVMHMVNHSMLKLVLFMSAGVIFMNIHKLDINDIRGFGRKKPLLKLAFFTGAAGLGGIPLWNGYASKTLLHESIVEYMEHGHELIFGGRFWHTCEWLFLITGGLTIAYMAKFFVAVFVEKHPERQEEYDERYRNYGDIRTKIALILSTGLVLLLGFLPGLTLDKLGAMAGKFAEPEFTDHTVRYFSPANLKGALISITIGVLVYLVVVRLLLVRKKEDGTTIYRNVWPKWLDLEDSIYRPLLKFLYSASALVMGAFDKVTDLIFFLFYKTTHRPHYYRGYQKKEKKRGLLREYLRITEISHASLAYGMMMLCVCILVIIVFLYYRIMGIIRF